MADYMTGRGFFFFFNRETGQFVELGNIEVDKYASIPDTLFGKPVIVSEVVGKNARCTRRLRKKLNGNK